jgi:hypothetical protein
MSARSLKWFGGEKRTGVAKPEGKDRFPIIPTSGRRGPDWTPERIALLDTAEVQQLRENAEKLGAAEVVVACDAVLGTRPRAVKRTVAPVARKQNQARVSRQKAFQARGVYLDGAESGWCGVRKADGEVVMTLWAPAIVSSEGGCSQCLWAPNVDGARPWSDTPGGQARLKHCRLALERGSAEGLLVYGEHFDGEAAEHNARTVYGVDPEQLVHFRVEQRGDEYWAVWGAKAAERAL